jgi:hypothetical protein
LHLQLWLIRPHEIYCFPSRFTLQIKPSSKSALALRPRVCR